MSNATKRIQVCFSLDEGFSGPTQIAIYSLFRTTKRQIDLHIIGYELSEASWGNFEKLCAGHGQNLFAHKLTRSDIVLPKHSLHHISPASFLRLLVTQFIEGEVIYIDGDTLVRSDIGELADIDIGDKIVAAAPDSNSILRDYKLQHLLEKGSPEFVAISQQQEDLNDLLGITHPSEHFNAGMIKLNLDNLKANKSVFDRFSSFDHAINEGRGRDQLHLNIVMRGHIYPLSLEWNAQKATQKPLKRLPANIYSEWEAARLKPKIIHFTGSGYRKPWLRLSKTLRARSWRRVLPYKKMMRDYARFLRQT